MPWLFLAFSAVSALLTWNVDHPRYRPGPLAALSFFAGWLVGELALHQILFQGVMAVGFIVLGGLSRWPGYLALALPVDPAGTFILT